MKTLAEELLQPGLLLAAGLALVRILLVWG